MQNKYCQNCRINTKQVFVESIWRCEECFNTHSEFLPHPESLLHEIALAGSHIIQLNEEIKRLQAENEKLISEATTNDFILLELNDMLKEKQQRVQEIEQERRWIPTSERNPHSNGLYDVWITGVHNSISAIYRNGEWNMSGVTHWRCKPQPPEDGE